MYTEDVYRIGRNNPKARFKRMKDGNICCFNFEEKLMTINEIIGMTICPSMNEEWELIKEPITFTEAMNGCKKTKPIKSEHNFELPNFWMRGISLKLEWINGMWEVE